MASEVDRKSPVASSCYDYTWEVGVVEIEVLARAERIASCPSGMLEAKRSEGPVSEIHYAGGGE